MAAAAFPRALLRERSHSWNLAGVAATLGVNAMSVAGYIRSDGGGFWACSMTDVSLSGNGTAKGRARQRESTLLWRAVRQVCNGGVGQIVVPRNDALFRPWPPGAVKSAAMPHGDGSFFSDESGYAQSVIDVTCYGGAPLRATAITIKRNLCGDLLGGESFSINHSAAGWRMYEIATVEELDTEYAIITFNPPLRQSIGNGVALEFDEPRCTMRLTSPSAMDLTVVPWTFNTASVSFIESFR